MEAEAKDKKNLTKFEESSLVVLFVGFTLKIVFYLSYTFTPTYCLH